MRDIQAGSFTFLCNGAVSAAIQSFRTVWKEVPQGKNAT
jgi:hypothetical protein